MARIARAIAFSTKVRCISSSHSSRPSIRIRQGGDMRSSVRFLVRARFFNGSAISESIWLSSVLSISWDRGQWHSQ